ncbi:MAG: MoaD/ThiS family protein [Phycisphaerales bacterium]|nr:MoaD/ThiS family protein [Phycisphaerales bacterium]
MAVARFTPHLYRYFPTLPHDGEHVGGATARDVLAELNRRYPGLAGYIVDDAGALRKHVNIFIEGQLLADRATLSDPVHERGEIFFFQALSGG